jgi:hypothetical protein
MPIPGAEYCKRLPHPTPMGIISGSICIDHVLKYSWTFPFLLFHYSSSPKDLESKFPPAQSTRRMGDQIIKDNKFLDHESASRHRSRRISGGDFLINPRHPRINDVVM